MTLNSNSQPEKSVIFLHIPRTAGVTLDAILERQYSPSRICSLYSTEQAREFKQLPEESRKKIELLNGHFMSVGIHEFLPNPSTYITLMRDPIDRVISHYYFVRRSGSHYLHKQVMSSQMSLQDYVSSEISIETNNGQTRLIAGLKEQPGIGIGKCSSEMLAIAKQNIRERFAVVGLTEEFDKSLVLFKQALGWKETFYTKRNQTKNRQALEQVPKETLKLIEGYNELDIELYSFAKNRFQEMIESQGKAFEKQLKQFQASNNRYGHLYSWLGLGVNKAKKLWLK